MVNDVEADAAKAPTCSDGDDESPGNHSARAKNRGERPVCFSTTTQECIFVLATTMAIGQAAFYSGMNIGITASIAETLNMSSAEITWITAGTSLTSGAFLLSFGKLADLFGRKVMFVASMILFAGIVLAAGFAPNAIFLDVFSGLVGLCSAAVVPPAVGALGAVYEKPSRRKNIAFACFSSGNPLGFVGGAIISGIASRAYNWRASYWALAVVYAIFAVMTMWAVPPDTHPREKLSREALEKFDLIGSMLIVAGLALFSSSLTLAADAPHGWRTGYVIALLVTGVVLVAGFLYWQSVARYPLMPLYIWKDRNFSLLNAVLGFGFMGFVSGSFWLALYLQRVKHLDALRVALYLLPQVLNGILVNVVTGLILHRVNNQLLMGIGALSYLAAFLILGFMKQNASYWAFIFPALMLSVVGADIQFNVVNMYVMSSLPPSQQSLAGGMFNTLTKLCQIVGLGMTTAVYTSMENKHRNTSSIRPYLSTYWLSAGFAGVGVVLVFFLKIGTQGGPSVEREERVENKTTKS